MANVTVIGEDGSIQSFEPRRSSFRLRIDDEWYEPAVTTEIEVESNQNQDTTGTLCGDKRTERTSEDPHQVMIRGICTNSGNPDELTADQLLWDVQEGDELSFTCDISDRFGLMTVSNVLVRQEQELVSVQTPITNGEQTAFRFQLQFGEEDNQ